MATNPRNILPLYITFCRHLRNLPLRALSFRCGISYDRLLDVEWGDAPSEAEACKLSEFFGVPPEELFAETPSNAYSDNVVNQSMSARWDTHFGIVHFHDIAEFESMAFPNH